MQLLTEKQVAQMLSISLQKLRNDRCLGRGLPYVKVTGGRSVRYIKEDVDADIISNKIQTNN